MARKNPTASKSTPRDEVVEGVERLPLPSGTNVKALDDSEKMPGHGSLGVTVSMQPNDGDNGPAPQATFATGKDLRSFEGGMKSDPTPAMPGA